MNNLTITKLNGGLGRRTPSGDMISGFLANGVAVSGGAQLGVVYRLKGIKDAMAIGLNAAYDTANSVLVYEHLNEAFRINANVDIYIMLVAQTVSYADMLDSTKTYAKKLLQESDGDIKQLFVAYNPAVAVTDFTATSAAITKAQELATEEYAQHRPVSIFLEGKGFKTSAPVDFRALNSKDVSVVVGQALAIANKTISAATPYKTYAAIGTLLGAVTKASVNENIAWIEKFNLLGGSLLSAGIDGTPINSISEGLKETLNDNGTIFFRTHTGKAGIYFNDSHTCTELTDDYAYIENNRTINKAVRAIRATILPRLNSPVKVDSDTGQLSPEVVKSYEVDGYKALEEMQNNSEVSSFDVYMNPNQDILSTSELEIEFELVPTGIARNIKGVIGFTNPF